MLSKKSSPPPVTVRPPAPDAAVRKPTFLPFVSIVPPADSTSTTTRATPLLFLASMNHTSSSTAFKVPPPKMTLWPVDVLSPDVTLFVESNAPGPRISLPMPDALA